MRILAIDAGWGGAVAYLVPKTKTRIIAVEDCPGDSLGILEFLRGLESEYGSQDWLVLIEANSPSPQFGARGNFGLGLNIGCWETALTAVGFTYRNVSPLTWRKLVSSERSRTKRGKKGRKEKAWRFARRNFPQFSDLLGDDPPNPRSPKQGRADALCILEFGRREYGDKT